MDLKRHTLDPPMADKWLAVSHPSSRLQTARTKLKDIPRATSSTASKHSKQAQQARIVSKHSKQAYKASTASKHSTANTAIKKATKPTSNQPQERGRRQGAKPFRYSPHPLQGEQGVLNPLSESQNLKLQAAPASAADPCPKCSQSDHFSDQGKHAEK